MNSTLETSGSIEEAAVAVNYEANSNSPAVPVIHEGLVDSDKGINITKRINKVMMQDPLGRESSSKKMKLDGR